MRVKLCKPCKKLSLTVDRDNVDFILPLQYCAFVTVILAKSRQRLEQTKTNTMQPQRQLPTTEYFD
jgi:hypothetical protein